jgi:hypothetical protein
VAANFGAPGIIRLLLHNDWIEFSETSVAAADEHPAASRCWFILFSNSGLTNRFLNFTA